MDDIDSPTSPNNPSLDEVSSGSTDTQETMDHHWKRTSTRHEHEFGSFKGILDTEKCTK